MNKRTIAGLGLAGLMIGGSVVGCTHSGGIAAASSKSEAAAIRQASDNAARASKALAKGDTEKAVRFAEAAVAMRPGDAGHRALLGGAYLKAGRFVSAEATFADVLALNPGDGRAALNLALAMIAQGKWDAARATLDSHAATIPASDRGLALALAGDPQEAVGVLVEATRTPQADAKTRQNLALAMALAGKWQEARSIIGVDMAPLEADQRIMQWAAFARPTRASDQVASLLGVTPAADPGRPVALALQQAPVAAPVMLAQAPADTATDAPAAAVPAVSGPPAIRFAERREVVQPLPAASAPVIMAKRGGFRVPAGQAEVASSKSGNWYVQLGAYDSPAVAREAWSRVQRRHAALSGQVPLSMTVNAGGEQLHRLSVGGFARAEADTLCRQVRARGGACFVREGAGDRMAAWARPAGAQLARL